MKILGMLIMAVFLKCRLYLTLCILLLLQGQFQISLPLDILHWFQPTLISLFSVFFWCSWIKKPAIGKPEEYINQEAERAEFQQGQSKVSHYCGLHADYSWWLSLIFYTGYKVFHGILLYPPMCLAGFTAY